MTGNTQPTTAAPGGTEVLTNKQFARLKQLTENNDHGTSYLEASQALGLPHLEEEFERINREHQRQGELSVGLEFRRRHAYTQLLAEAKRLLTPKHYDRLYMCF